MISPFEVMEFSSANLFRALSNEYCQPDEVATQPQSNYLCGYLATIGAKTVVVERKYTDGDYLEDFASYYVRCHARYERCCKRLHFFGAELSDDTLRNLIQGSIASEQGNRIRRSYLGFVVARPLPRAIVGRTLLKTYPPEGDRRHYTVLRSYDSHLFGMKLSVLSLPFQEQDSVLAACATVALWCAFHKTNDIFGTSAPRPAIITSTANSGDHRGRLVPSHGLIIEEMCQAVRDTGLEPELIDCSPDNQVPLVSLAHGHLEMGIPVILIVQIGSAGLHAITLTGYSLQSTRVMAQEMLGTHPCIPMIGLRINEFYGHDDQIGPFSRLFVQQPTATSPLQLKGDWKDNAGQPILLEPVAALIPIYNKIRVTFLDAQVWLTRFSGLLPLLKISTSSFEWSLSLITTNVYKETLKTMSLRPEDLLRVLLEPQPRFMWRGLLRVSEIEVFELLVDATDMANSFPVFDAIWRHEGFRKAMDTFLRLPAMQPSLIGALTRRFLDLLKDSLSLPTDVPKIS